MLPTFWKSVFSLLWGQPLGIAVRQAVRSAKLPTQAPHLRRTESLAAPLREPKISRADSVSLSPESATFTRVPVYFWVALLSVAPQELLWKRPAVACPCHRQHHDDAPQLAYTVAYTAVCWRVFNRATSSNSHFLKVMNHNFDTGREASQAKWATRSAAYSGEVAKTRCH